MKKLFKLKKWLTVGETASYLTLKLGEKVSEADVLRLALDGHLVLSVNFVNHANAKKGKVVSIDNAKWKEMHPFLAQSLPKDIFPEGKPVMVMEGLQIDDRRVLELEDKVVTLEGVRDLAMVGAEVLDIENRCLLLAGGPEVTLMQLGGAFVCGDSDTMFQLVERFDSNDSDHGYTPVFQDMRDRLQELYADDPRGKEVIENNLDAHEQELKKRAQVPPWCKSSEAFVPAPGLPPDSFLVVRTAALSEFEQSICEASTKQEKPLQAKERNTLLTIIAALCNYSDIDPAGRNSAQQITGLVHEIGASVTDETVRGVLDKIPDAVERRSI